VGTTPVTCTATDPHGNSASGSFTVTITDHTAPTVTVSGDITREATGATTAVTFTSSALDLVDGSVTPICAPASGFAFPLGATPVTCTATDAHGNGASGHFTVTITDHTAPALTLPANITATATTPSGATVTFTATASDLAAGTRPVVCAPASGSTFPIGTTTVACTANDGHGNTAQGSFTVTVVTAPQPGRMTGDGSIAIGSVTHSFDFFVQERGSGADLSAISYRMTTARPGPDQVDQFVAIAVTGVTFYNVPGVAPGTRPASGVDTVTFTGRGWWNGRSGYTFEARATDAGEPGRGHDSFAITIRSATGAVVASVNATITTGNIQSLREVR
jgi:HYR domain